MISSSRGAVSGGGDSAAAATSTDGAESATDRRWMELALAEAERARSHGDVPVGAVVVRGDEVVACGHNRRELDGDPLAHAELVAIRRAAAVVGRWRLVDCTLYVTLEPCAMCAGALVNSRTSTLVYGAPDPKAGFCGSLGNLVEDPRLNHRLTVRRGIMHRESSALLRAFFAELRAARARDP